MSVFDKKLKIWIIDDLEERRNFHEEIIKEHCSEASIFKIAHPLHLKYRLKTELPNIKACHNIFLSDYNMEWLNVEWTPDLIDIHDLETDDSYNNFPGTQKVLDEFKKSIPSFLLIMLSTLVVRDKHFVKAGFSHVETVDNSWTYEDLELNETGINSIHKLSKPFSASKLDQVLSHYRYLIKHFTKV